MQKPTEKVTQLFELARLKKKLHSYVRWNQLANGGKGSRAGGFDDTWY